MQGIRCLFVYGYFIIINISVTWPTACVKQQHTIFQIIELSLLDILSMIFAMQMMKITGVVVIFCSRIYILTIVNK